MACYGVIHISLGHISALVHILCISCHLFICTFHFISHFGWPACLWKSLSAYMYLFNLRIANHILIIKRFFFIRLPFSYQGQHFAWQISQYCQFCAAINSHSLYPSNISFSLLFSISTQMCVYNIIMYLKIII